MPGPVSDSYDPEFGTGANAHDVREAIDAVRERLGQHIGEELKNIVQVVHGNEGLHYSYPFSEQELRVLRFCCDRAKESI
jgi:hypothetical protein